MTYLIDPRSLIRFADQSAAIYLRTQSQPSEWTRGYADAMETIRIYAEAMDAPEVDDEVAA